MDHWGDPWADSSANEDKSAVKDHATSPLPPTQPSAPQLFTGFVDDAGWGNDEGLGGWNDVPSNDNFTTTAAPYAGDSASFSNDDETLSYSHPVTAGKREEPSEHSGPGLVNERP